MFAPDWNKELIAFPNAHFLQTNEWGQVKTSYGWIPLPQSWDSERGSVMGKALVLQRQATLGPFKLPFRVLYVPRGPVLDWSDAASRKIAYHSLEEFARKQHAIFLKIDPDVICGHGLPGDLGMIAQLEGVSVMNELQQRGWNISPDQIQFRNTVLLDLSGTEQDWLDRMKQKTRYNLRLASKKGIVVRDTVVADLPLLYRMYSETSVRDGFVIRPEEYYLQVWQTFLQAGLAEGLIAELDSVPIAAVIIFHLGERAWYVYGMSRQVHREKMPNYLLQWEAMRRAREWGCREYDLWGAPDTYDENDRLWGVYRFKEGLGGKVVQTIGAWDYPVKPNLYRLYTRVLPSILSILRRRGMKLTRWEAGA